jgi:hypothetical protein
MPHARGSNARGPPAGPWQLALEPGLRQTGVIQVARCNDTARRKTPGHTHRKAWPGTFENSLAHRPYGQLHPRPLPPHTLQGAGPPLNTWFTSTMMSADETVPEQLQSPAAGHGWGGAPLLKT